MVFLKRIIKSLIKFGKGKKKKKAKKTVKPKRAFKKKTVKKSPRKKRPRLSQKKTSTRKKKKTVKRKRKFLSVKKSAKKPKRKIGKRKSAVKAKKAKTVPRKKPAPQKSQQPQGVLIGRITHYFSRIEVVVLEMTHGRLSIGERILIEGHGYQFTQKVASLQIESHDVKSARKGQLVGLKVVKKAHAGNRVYKLP